MLDRATLTALAQRYQEALETIRAHPEEAHMLAHAALYGMPTVESDGEKLLHAQTGAIRYVGRAMEQIQYGATAFAMTNLQRAWEILSASMDDEGLRPPAWGGYDERG